MTHSDLQLEQNIGALTDNRDEAIRLIEQALEQLKGHRHDFKNFLNNYTMLSANNMTANRQIDEIHGAVKVGQGALQAFSTIPKDLAEIKSGLLNKATDRSGIPYQIVMLLLTLFAILVAIPTWLPLLTGSNIKLNVSRDGVGIESQQSHQ